jgi:hypothetical protein
MLYRSEMSVLHSFTFTIGTITMFSWPSILPNRIMHGTILLAGALIYYHWAAMLISYLSICPFHSCHIPFNSLREMYEKSNYRLVLVPGGSYEDAFKLSSDTLWQNIYMDRIKPYLEEYKAYGYGSLVSQQALEGDHTAVYRNYLEVA